jgi:cell division protein ZapA (FtsZ GTPase activity inhibitor)
MGHSLKLYTDRDSEYIKKIVNIVEKEINDIKNNFKPTSTLDIALSAAISFADKYYERTEKDYLLLKNTSEKLDEVVSYIGNKV